MEKLTNKHPGEVLSKEFLLPIEITAYRLSKDLEIPQTRISQILKGRRRITADIALKLSSYSVIRLNSGLDYKMITTMNSFRYRN